MTRTGPMKQKNDSPNPLWPEVVAVACLALSTMLAFTLWRGTSGMGLFGVLLRRVFLSILGSGGSGIFVFLLAGLGLRLLFAKNKDRASKIETDLILNSLLLFLLVLTGLQLQVGKLPISDWLTNSIGGFVGNALVWALLSIFGTFGSWVVLAGLVLIVLLGLTRLSLGDFLRRIGRWLRHQKEWLARHLKKSELMETGEPDYDLASSLTITDYQEMETEMQAAASTVQAPLPEDDREGPLQEWQVEQLPIPQKTIDAEAYQLPPLTLLTQARQRPTSKHSHDIYEKGQIIEKVFTDFGIRAKVVHATKGPTVTRFEIQPAPGTKISHVTSLADDIALNLACSEVRIEAPIPGKAAIGIEVPNETTEPVYLRDVLDSSNFRNSKSPLTIALGKDITGKAIIANLEDMPHLLIAGATGSGKSVCINSMIVSIFYKAKPDRVRLLMIDPKVVELANYNGLPHLLAPVVSQPKKAAAALKWATGEMEKRYQIFAKAGVRDIARYNEWAASAGKEKLPLIVIIIDELADLMMVARADVEDAICRLAQMARAAGMHLVIGTQRPSADVITGLIKANIPSRISFAVSSAVDSRVILDMGGAEKLLGKGDMLFAPVGLSKPLRVQGAFVSNRELTDLTEFIGMQMEAQYVDALCSLEDLVQGHDDEAERDELFMQAVQVVAEAGQASVSMLQRRLRVGYTRAARMIDQLEVAGVVGPYEGSKPRVVYKEHDLIKKLTGMEKREI